MPLTSGSDASLVAVHKTTDASIATGNQTTAMGQQPYVQTNAAAQGTASKPPLINSQGMCPPGAPTAMAIPPRMPPLVGANNATAAIPPPHPSSSLLAGSSTAAAAAASMRGTPLSVAVPPLQNSSAAAAGLPASPSTGQPSLHSLGVGSPRPPAAPVGVGSPCPPVAPVGMGSPCPPGHSAAQRFGSQAQPYVLSPPNTGARAAPLQQQPPPPSASGGASAGTFSTLSQPQQAAMGASVAQPVRTPVRPPPGGQPHAGYVPVPYSPRGSKGDPARDAKEGDEVIPVWTLPPPRRLDWEVVGMENSKVQLRCRPKPKSVQPLHGMGLEGPLPPPRKPPSIATEFKIPLPAQVARTIEKMKNDFFVVNLCSAGSNLTPSQDTTPWNAEEVGIGPAAAAGRRRGAPTAANVLKQENEAAAGRHHEAAAPSTDGAGGTVQKGGRANVPHSPSKLARMEAASHGGATEVKSEDVKTEVKPFSEAAAAAPEVKLEAGAEQRVDAPAAAGAPQLASPPQALGKRSRSDMEDAEKDGMVTRSETAPLGIDVNPILSRYLGSAPLPAVELMEDTADPDPLQSAPFVDSRHTFLEMCQWRHYQFDTLRRAKHASLMTLHHLHNTTVHDNKEHAPHCAVCGQQIKGVRWHCPVCPDFELCSTCNTHDPNSASLHPHLLTPYRVSYEGALRA